MNNMGRRSRARKRKRRRSNRQEGLSMATEIFSANPKSFKIHRTSPFAASKLKPSVSAKVLNYLPDLTDDVFAEYITVLVCNGKNQYQAREDLDAFLGERTEEFVSWLWDYLLSCSRKFGIETSSKNHDLSFTGPGNSDKDDDPRTRGNCGTDLADDLLMNDEQVLLQTSRKKILSKVEPAEKTFVETCAADSSGEGSPPVLSPTRGRGIRFSKKPKLILDCKACVALKEISSTDPTLERPQSSVSGISPRSARTLSTHTERPRVSVWDRLGKPSNDVPTEGEGVHLLDVGDEKEHEEVHDQRESEKLLNCGAGTFDPHAASNIGRKRLFGETSGSTSTGLVPSKDKKKLSPLGEICQQFNKSMLATKDVGTPKSLASKMLEMKQRLQNMEMEMSKLRSKQVKIEKDGTPCQMSNPSELKHLEEDIDSRTIFVTNVHFAVTKEGLLSFFAKCGTVVKVVKMTDTVTAKPNGSAYVTFASKDSIDRALALSGTPFFSRIVKVSRKEEADAAASTSTHVAHRPSGAPILSRYTSAVPHIPYYYSASRLQWRRESASSPSGLSASASVQKMTSSSS